MTQPGANLCVNATHVFGWGLLLLTLLPPFWQGLSHLNPIVYRSVVSATASSVSMMFRWSLLWRTGGLYCGVLFDLLVADPTGRGLRS